MKNQMAMDFDDFYNSLLSQQGVTGLTTATTGTDTENVFEIENFQSLLADMDAKDLAGKTGNDSDGASESFTQQQQRDLLTPERL